MVQRSTVLAGASGFRCSVARFVLGVGIFLRPPSPAHAFISTAFPTAFPTEAPTFSCASCSPAQIEILKRLAL